MSLKWYLEGIKGHDTVCWRDVESTREAKDIREGRKLVTAWREDHGFVQVLEPVTFAIIMAMMSIRLGPKITEKNKRQFAARMDHYQDVFGAFLRDKRGNPLRVTTEDVFEHVGLETNVGDKLTDKRWGAWVFETAQAEFLNRLMREEES